MKRTKLLIPTLATIGSLAMATPILTACNNKKDPVVEYTVHFESNGGSAIADVKVKSGDLVDEPTDPTKNGYTFAGWHKDPGLTQAFRFNKDKITADTILYAKWVQTGGQVDKNQWKQAFKDLADTREELTFWTKGSIKILRHESGSAEVSQELTISDIIFNENRHYGLMSVKDVESGLTATQDLAGESFNDFFFYAEQLLVEGQVQEKKYDVGYNTEITDVFYTIYESATDDDTYDEYKYNTTKEQYEHNGQDYTSIVKFFTEDGKKKVQKLYLSEKTAEGDDLVVDITVNYTDKPIDLPEGWDSNKPKAIADWGSAKASKAMQKNKEIYSSLICSFKVSADQKGCKNIKFSYDGAPMPDPNDYQFIICVTNDGTQKWESVNDDTWDKTNKIWKPTLISTNGLVEGDQVNILLTQLGDGDIQIAGVLSES